MPCSKPHFNVLLQTCAKRKSSLAYCTARDNEFNFGFHRSRLFWTINVFLTFTVQKRRDRASLRARKAGSKAGLRMRNQADRNDWQDTQRDIPTYLAGYPGYCFLVGSFHRRDLVVHGVTLRFDWLLSIDSYEK
jgi:hypothetical protein